jgi:hypothetical protein
VRVALYEKDAVAVSYDFTSHAADARVTETAGSGESPCYRDNQGFRCTAALIAPRTLEVDYRPHRGILAPVDGARTTHIDFTEVPLGATLVGYTGIHDYYSRKNADGPVDFRVIIDGRERAHVVARNADGWRRFTIDTAGENGTRHSVRFAISAPDPAWRTFGFHAEVRR